MPKRCGAQAFRSMSFRFFRRRRVPMQLFCSSNKERSRRLHLGQGSSETGARFGGRAPIGVRPSSPTARYLLTVPLTADSSDEVSVFVNISPDFIYGGSMGKLIRSANIEAVRHELSGRGTGSRYDSALSEHP